MNAAKSPIQPQRIEEAILLVRGQRVMLERKIEGHDTSIRTLFDALQELAAPPAQPPREIGFHVKEHGVLSIT